MNVIVQLLIIAFFATVLGSFVLEQYKESLTHAITFVLLPVSFVLGLVALLGGEPIYGMDNVNCLLACIFVFIGSLAMRRAKRCADYHRQKGDIAFRAGDEKTCASERAWTQYYLDRAYALQSKKRPSAPKTPHKGHRC